MNILNKLKRNGIKAYIKNVPTFILHRYNSHCDKKICGIALPNALLTKYKDLGATNPHPSNWIILKEIFKDAHFSSDDKIIDIGSAQGRVIAFLLKIGFPGRIYGIELDSELVNLCKSWSKRYSNVSIIGGNAFAHNFDEYTILFMGRPFEAEQFKTFIKKLENEITHPITLYLNWSSSDEKYLENREGWSLIKSKNYFKKYGLPLAGSPQKYSVFSYTPKLSNSQEI